MRCFRDEVVKALHLWPILAFLLKLHLGEDAACVLPQETGKETQRRPGMSVPGAGCAADAGIVHTGCGIGAAFRRWLQEGARSSSLPCPEAWGEGRVCWLSNGGARRYERGTAPRCPGKKWHWFPAPRGFSLSFP